jgi:hypothetical protein
MSRFLRIVRVDESAFTDALHEFVTDPSATRNDRDVILELNEMMPEMVDILESMVLDGTEDRQDVADLVTYIFNADPRTGIVGTEGSR